MNRTDKNRSLGVEREDYLQSIHNLEKIDGQARISDIARSLDVSKPSASQMMLRLKKEGLVSYTPYQELKLTAKGRKAAISVFERRTAIADFLTVLGVSKKTQEKDIHGLEHHLSPETLKKLREITKLLQNKKTA